MQDSLAVLTNDEMARLILRRLWQIHDAEGVSMGRCLSNVLLESAMHILPLPEMHDPDVFDVFELLDEAVKRKRKISHHLKATPRLQRISNRTLATLVLHELQAWYREDAEKNPLMALTFQWRLTNSAVGLLSLPRGFKKPASWSREDLIEESRERYRKYLNRQAEQRGF